MDTIAAIATSLGESGIGIVRISGKEAVGIANKIFVSKDGKKPEEFRTYTMHYGWIVDSACGLPVDEVILTFMRSPRSYTKEDVVEINCHGGLASLRRILDLVMDNGARLAEPGEFTKRAFLNGRIDLAQAEAVINVIRAKTEMALEMGLVQLKGGLSRQINNIRDGLLDALVNLEANIDFPEEDISPENLNSIRLKLADAREQTCKLLEGAKYGRIVQEGIRAVICGRPNVGKSSLLNALLRQERAIVTHIPGTTRDSIEEIIDIKGIPVRIVDTAGILKPRNLIEKKAIAKSKEYIKTADLVILLFDGQEKLRSKDKEMILDLKKKAVLAVVNKIDKKIRIEVEYLRKHFKNIVEISAKQNKNIDLLEEDIGKIICSGKAEPSQGAFITNTRQFQLLAKAEKLIADSLNSIDNEISMEFVAQDIKDALGEIDTVLGKNFSDELLDNIFSEFCIGK